VTTAEAILDRMSTDQKIGQILSTSVGHHSSAQINADDGSRRSADEHRRALAADRERVAQEISRYQLGGVCYFAGRPDGNLPEEVAETTVTLQAAAPVGLLISTDQEGGRVARLRRGFTTFGSAMSMAALDDPTAVREAAAVSGRELRAVGINHVFAPVADVNSDPANPVIGTRSFGSDPARVARNVVAAIAGYRDAAVASTAKHFPGHGDTATDSHLGLPVVGRTVHEWRQVDQPAFTAAVAAGVDAVMSGHLVLRWAASAADPDVPATYSRRVLTDLLRTEMGFAGMVVSDALEMAGALQGRDSATAAVDALLAGVDQLLMPVDLPATVAALQQAVSNGVVPMERLDQACLRVLRLKERLGLLNGSAEVDPAAAGRSQELAMDLAARAVTVIGPPFLAPSIQRPVAVVGPAPVSSDLAQGLTRLGRPVLGPDDAVPADAAVFVVSTGLGQTGELERVRQLLSAYPDAVLVLAGSPYGVELVGGHHTALLSYGNTPVHVQGLAIAMADPTRPPSGWLPVALGSGR
jgi:beta-N-acetylhexosaminidase